MSRTAALALALFACVGCSPEAAIQAVFHRHGPHVVEQALDVAECESNMQPEAVSPGGHLGLFQLAPRYHAWRFGGGDWRDPLVNTLAAESLWKEQGWRPWSCAR